MSDVMLHIPEASSFTNIGDFCKEKKSSVNCSNFVKSPKHTKRKNSSFSQANHAHHVKNTHYKKQFSSVSNQRATSSVIENKAFEEPVFDSALKTKLVLNSKMCSNIVKSCNSNSYPNLLEVCSKTSKNSNRTIDKHLKTTSVDYLDCSSGLLSNLMDTNQVDESEASAFPTVMNDVDSRRSSTSTVRERNTSIDSAYSQISIIDIKELEEIEQNEASYSGDNLCNFKELRSRSKSDAWESIPSDSFESPEMFSLPSSFSENNGIKRKSIFEGHQITVPTECFFPRPQQGQSITSFLSSNDFNISAELDRENAHFCISEALIAAIEHMKWVCTLKLREAEESSEDDLNSQQKHTQRKFSQRIRIRRKEVQKQKIRKNVALLSDGKTDTATSQSASPPVSSHSSEFEADSIGSEEEVDDLELSAEHTESNLSSIKENGLSLSMASLYSDADIHRIPFPSKDNESKKFLDSESNNLSAESVALSLIRRFSEKHLPKASELQWLVSEHDAPQRLLPLPDSWPVSPDAIEEEYYLEKTRLRGNLDWAPPRPQIIFIIHPTLKRKIVIERQKYRCAGCGLKIEKNLMDRIRYCDYFGKYFCQCCHSNNLAYIPGRLLWKWDFAKYYVSKFAWKLLDQMYSDPLFNIQDLNCNLYQKVKQLERCRVYRTQLFYLKDFIKTCRKAEFVQVVLEQQPHHIIFEPHQYSLSELVQVKSGELSKYLSQLINQCLSHVRQCILCQAKGFICEICRKDKDIIFPYQLDRVVACQKCGTCLHKKCFKNVNCPKCVRIEDRKKRLSEIKSDEEL